MPKPLIIRWNVKDCVCGSAVTDTVAMWGRNYSSPCVFASTAQFLVIWQWASWNLKNVLGAAPPALFIAFQNCCLFLSPHAGTAACFNSADAETKLINSLNADASALSIPFWCSTKTLDVDLQQVSPDLKESLYFLSVCLNVLPAKAPRALGPKGVMPVRICSAKGAGQR